MQLCKNTKSTRYYSSVNEIPEAVWKALQCTANAYFHPKYLNALEQNNRHISFAYIVLLDQQQKAIAFASIQIVNFQFNEIEKSMNKSFHNLKNIGKKIGIVPKLNPIKLLVCGNIFVSGEYGIFISENQDKQQVIKKLAKAISHVSKANKTLSKDISIYLIKDFIKESLRITDELHDVNYYSFHVEPNMVLQLDKHWHTFQDYLDAMKTKFRVKAKRALHLSTDIVVKETSRETIKTFLPEITKLYKKVSAKADFNLGELNPETYSSLKQEFGENYIFKTYWYQDKIVGFMSGIIHVDSLDAHFVGIDYEPVSYTHLTLPTIYSV